MYKLCQTEQSAKRQREMEHGLLMLMQKRRYEDISVSDLCEYMQIPRKSFYRYFTSKDGALVALLDHTMTDFFDTSSYKGSKEGAVLEDLGHYFQFWYDQKPLLDALQFSHLSGFLVERANAFAIQEGSLPNHFKNLSQSLQDIAISFSVCGLMSIVLQWHHQNFLIPPEDMTRLAISILNNPLLSK